MKSTWRVTRVTATTTGTVAKLQRVEWFKPDPEWTSGDEFQDATPGEAGAEHIDADGTLSLDIRGALDLHPGDDVIVTLTVAQVLA